MGVNLSKKHKEWLPNYRLAAGCVVMNPKTDHILLLRRSIHETSRVGLWELPGGKVEANETPEQTAINETIEEAGPDLGPMVWMGQELEPHIDDNMEKIYYAYLVEAPNPKVVLSDEHDAFMWITVEGALTIQPLSHHAQFMLSQL